MSLRKENEAGIFKTLVTWQILEAETRRGLHTACTFGDGKTAEIVGDGKGFCSRIALVTFDWQGEGAAELPEKMLIKIASCLNAVKMTEACDNPDTDKHVKEQMWDTWEHTLKKLHNSECAFYALVTKKLGSQQATERFGLPKYYFSVPFTPSSSYGLLAMDLIPDVLPVHLFTNLTVDEIKQVTRRLARVQAFCLREGIDEQSGVVQCRFADVYETMCNEEGLQGMFALARQFGAKDDEFVEKLNCVEASAMRLLDPQLTERIPEEMGVPKVFVHGDLWSANTLFQAEGDGRRLAAICDWQMIHFGAATEDIIRILCAAMSGETRRTHWKDILSDFHEELVREMRGDEPPYTLQQLEEQYRRMFPFAALILVPIVFPIVAYFSSLGDNSDNEAMMAVVMEKVKCMVDDIITYDQENK